eukprot:6807805-Alexandrium_andersonii.AAC.1
MRTRGRASSQRSAHSCAAKGASCTTAAFRAARASTMTLATRVRSGLGGCLAVGAATPGSLRSASSSSGFSNCCAR